MKLIREQHYQRKEQKFFKKHPELLDKYARLLKQLQIAPFESKLKTHQLKGTLSEFYACSLTYQYRVIFTFIIHNNTIVLVDIGTHDEVY